MLFAQTLINLRTELEGGKVDIKFQCHSDNYTVIDIYPDHVLYAEDRHLDKHQRLPPNNGVQILSLKRPSKIHKTTLLFVVG